MFDDILKPEFEIRKNCGNCWWSSGKQSRKPNMVYCSFKGHDKHPYETCGRWKRNFKKTTK